MTQCETRKDLSYSRLGTAISQENGGLNQVLRLVKPPTCMTVVNSSVTLTKKRGDRTFFPGLWDWDFLSSGIQEPGIPNADFGNSKLHLFNSGNRGFKFLISGFRVQSPSYPPFFYMPSPETLEFINTDTLTNTNKIWHLNFWKFVGQQTWLELSCG